MHSLKLKRNSGNSSSSESYGPLFEKKRRKIFITEKPSDQNGNREVIFKRGKLLGEIPCFSEPLGRGGFANVYEVIDCETNEKYALKIVSKSKLRKQKQLDKLRSEIKIHRDLGHRNVCKFERYFEDHNYVYIVLEYCLCKTVSELLNTHKKFSETESKYLLYQVLLGLKYMHDKCIIHRDLKLGNLLLDKNMTIKICDFGLAAKLDYETQRKRTICGTPNYIAPEIISNNRTGHSFEVDVWSFGVILYTFLYGKPPFETKCVKKTYRFIKQTKYSFPKGTRISKEGKKLIRDILQKEPTKRPSVDDILKHPFFSTKNSDFIRFPKSFLKYKKKFHSQSVASIRIPLQSLTKDQMNTRKEKIKKNIVNTNKERASNEDLENGAPKVWIAKYLNYTDKYGMAYLLNSGVIGCFFNDHTMMLFNKTTKFCRYFEKEKENSELTKISFQLDNYPEKLRKKCILINYFKSCFEENLGKYLIPDDNDDNVDIYVKMFLKNQDALCFRYSDKSIQVMFEDSSEIILTNEAQMITYKDKFGTKETFSLSDFLKKPEYSSKQVTITKRLKYTKKLLNRLLKI